jgi:two-component system aerobic respiration control sensor histidine kinase ArcB
VSDTQTGKDRLAHSDMALLGHDIRAAMSDVLGGLRLIDHAKLDRETQLQLNRVKAAGDTLARLLDVALHEWSGEVPLFPSSRHENLALLDLLEDAERRWSGHAQEHGLRLCCSFAPDLPTIIGIDQIMLERIISNVLSNAVKYAGHGDVTFSAVLDDAACLVVSVSDEGPGFEQQALDRLFEFRSRPEGAKRPGTGMGLHIGKDLVDQIGGTLQVFNKPSGGAQVDLILPKSSWSLKRHSTGDDSLPDLRDQHVLVVEDSLTNQLVVCQMLDQMGATYAVASDGTEGLTLLQSESFDFALIDIELPGLSGLDLMRAIRATKGVDGQLPVLAITAYILRANREAIFEAGADGILAKPLNCLDDFGHAIADLLRRTLQTTSDQHIQFPPAKPFQQGKVHDPHVLQHLLGIAGPAGREELLTRIESDLRQTAQQLTTALACDDPSIIRAKTHILIALSGAIGARSLQALAEVANDASHQNDTGRLMATGPPLIAQLETLITEIVQIPRAANVSLSGTPAPDGAK